MLLTSKHYMFADLLLLNPTSILRNAVEVAPLPCLALRSVSRLMLNLTIPSECPLLYRSPPRVTKGLTKQKYPHSPVAIFHLPHTARTLALRFEGYTPWKCLNRLPFIKLYPRSRPRARRQPAISSSRLLICDFLPPSLSCQSPTHAPAQMSQPVP